MIGNQDIRFAPLNIFSAFHFKVPQRINFNAQPRPKTGRQVDEHSFGIKRRGQQEEGEIEQE